MSINRGHYPQNFLLKHNFLSKYRSYKHCFKFRCEHGLKAFNLVMQDQECEHSLRVWPQLKSGHWQIYQFQVYSVARHFDNVVDLFCIREKISSVRYKNGYSRFGGLKVAISFKVINMKGWIDKKWTKKMNTWHNKCSYRCIVHDRYTHAGIIGNPD